LNLPEFVQIEPVGQCNLACRMCPVVLREEKPPAFMPYDAFCRLLDQFPAVRELHLQGLGEPLLHPRFFDMVRYAAQRGIEVSTNTNLTALSERRAEECVKSGLARLHVSLDAAEARAYEYIRVGARFSKVLRNLGWLNQAKERLHAAQPEIRLVAVAMRANLEQLPALVRLARRYRVHSLSIQHLAHDFSGRLDSAAAAQAARRPRSRTLRLAVARRLHRVFRRGHAVLHGRDARPEEFRQHDARRRRTGVEQ